MTDSEVPATTATPAAVAAAADAGVNIEAIEGSGKDGKVTVADVAAAAPIVAAPPTAAEEEAQKAEIVDQLGYHPASVTGELEGIFSEFRHSAAVWALPLEWLVDSIKAGKALPHDDYRPAPGN